MRPQPALFRLLALLASSSHAQPPGTTVYHNFSEGYHTYRIPSLIATPRGILIAFAEGRARFGFAPPAGDTADCYGEGASAADWRCTNKDVVYKRSLDGGAHWSPVAALALANDTHFYTNPQGLAAPAALFLLYMRCLAPTDGGNAFRNCTTVLQKSEDEGATWAPLGDVPPAQQSSGGSGGVALASGRLVFSAPGSQGAAPGVGALLSDDGGRTWVWGANAPEGGENQVAEAAPGSLLMTIRRKNNTRALVRSADGGGTWGAPEVMAVSDPDCQASLARVAPQGGGPGWLLFANPHTSGLLPYALGRQNVTVQASRDGGSSWTPFFLVDEGPSAYTSLAQLLGTGRGPGSCGILYEESADLPVDFRSIRFVAFDCAPPWWA